MSGAANIPDNGIPGGEPTQVKKPARVTVRTLDAMRTRGERFACLTAYDATMARLLHRAGVHVLLVGDTAAEMVLGYRTTVQMPLDVLIALTAAVRRGAPDALVMGDMPFMSYHCGDDDAVRNAGRFVTEGGADIVKLEMDSTFAPLVKRLSHAGIAVCAHVGSRPQHVVKTGGYRAAGRTAEDASRIVRDAIALEAAGASMLLVEAVPGVVAERIMESTGVPVIGIGAGAKCHGQVLVVHDLLGLSETQPAFAEPMTDLGSQITRVAAEWAARVARGDMFGKSFAMPPEELARFMNNPHPGDGFAESDMKAGGTERTEE